MPWYSNKQWRERKERLTCILFIIHLNWYVNCACYVKHKRVKVTQSATQQVGAMQCFFDKYIKLPRVTVSVSVSLPHSLTRYKTWPSAYLTDALLWFLFFFSASLLPSNHRASWCGYLLIVSIWLIWSWNFVLFDHLLNRFIKEREKLKVKKCVIWNFF